MGGSEVENETNFGGDPDHHADCPIRNPAISQQIIS